MFKYQLRSAVGMPGHKTKTDLQTERLINLLQSGTAGDTGKSIVKVNEELSRMNNRLYRQCRTYDVGFGVSNVKNLGVNETLTLDFYTLPNTWFVHGAIKHSFETYMQMMSDELAQGIRMARWHDFAINEQDPDGAWQFYRAALWDGGASSAWAEIGTDESISDSSVTDSGGTSKGFNLFGNESNSYNIFSEFAKKLAYGTADDPTVSSDQPYDGLLDLDDADVLAERGDAPPYDRDFSTWLHDGDDDQNILVCRDSIVVDPGAGSSRLSTRTFTAPLGLVFVCAEVDGSAADVGTTNPALYMRVAPGKYKGVRSHSLTE